MAFGDRSERTAASPKQVESEDMPEGKNSIAETNLFAFSVRSAVVADRHFVDHNVDLGELGRHFDFNAKAARFENHVPDDVSSKRLIAGFDIRHVEIRQRIA